MFDLPVLEHNLLIHQLANVYYIRLSGDQIFEICQQSPGQSSDMTETGSATSDAELADSTLELNQKYNLKSTERLERGKCHGR